MRARRALTTEGWVRRERVRVGTGMMGSVRVGEGVMDQGFELSAHSRQCHIR